MNTQIHTITFTLTLLWFGTQTTTYSTIMCDQTTNRNKRGFGKIEEVKNKKKRRKWKKKEVGGHRGKWDDEDRMGVMENRSE